MGTEATQAIRHASLTVADASPAKPAAKPAGQGSAAPTPPPPPVGREPSSRATGGKPDIVVKEANKKQPHYEFFQLTPDNTRGVLQHEYSIVTSAAKRNQLATYGAGPCVIVAVWNPDAKKAGLAHVDTLTDMVSVKAFVSQVVSGRKDSTKILVHLVGGDGTTTEMQAKLVNTIKNDPALELVSADLGGGGLVVLRSAQHDDFGIPDDSNNIGRSLAISATTGEISSFASPSMIDPGRDSEIRLRLISLDSSSRPLHKVPENLFKYPETK